MRFCVLFVTAFAFPISAFAERFNLLTGVDTQRYPGVARAVIPMPGPGFPGTFYDGDRLAGTADVGPTVNYVGLPPGPMFEPNQFGSLSFLFRRGSVPAGPNANVPFMGIEFLGGPLLDLDGDLDNDFRSLTPVFEATPVVIPDTTSFIDLTPDTASGAIQLEFADITGNNEGGPNIQPEIATILVVLAGTTSGAAPGPAINPAIDTRAGDLVPFNGAGGLQGVWRIEDLGYELWEDTIDPASASAAELGTLQFLGRFDGWLIERGVDGEFPTLAGHGMTTQWPEIDSSQVGNSFNTAFPPGGMATITAGVARDQFTAPNNGGLPLVDFAGDLGGYLDAVVTPRVPASATRYVYLEAAGFGINNSMDPVFTDTVSYDAVIIAANDPCDGVIACDSNCDGLVNNFDIDPFVLALVSRAEYEAGFPNCNWLCNNDANNDGTVNNFDIDPFVLCLTGG